MPSRASCSASAGDRVAPYDVDAVLWPHRPRPGDLVVRLVKPGQHLLSRVKANDVFADLAYFESRGEALRSACELARNDQRVILFTGAVTGGGELVECAGLVAGGDNPAQHASRVVIRFRRLVAVAGVGCRGSRRRLSQFQSASYQSSRS